MGKSYKEAILTFEERVKANMNRLIDRYGAFGAWEVARRNVRGYRRTGNEHYELLYAAIELKLYEYLEENPSTNYLAYKAMCQAFEAEGESNEEKS